MTQTLPLLRYADARVRAVEEVAGGAEGAMAGEDDPRSVLEELMPIIVRELIDMSGDMRGLWRYALRRTSKPCGLADLEELGTWMRLLFRRTVKVLRMAVQLCHHCEINLGMTIPRAAELPRAAEDFREWSARVLSSWPSGDWSGSVQLDLAQAERSAQDFREGKGIDGEELLTRLNAEGG